MTATNDPADPAPASRGEPMAAQFGPHRFHAGEGGGSEQFRGARFDAADLRGARFTDEERTVIDCIAVVMDEEIEHYRFAVRDLAVLEAS
jgi:Phosphoesterase family